MEGHKDSMAGKPWTKEEVILTVNDYFSMLVKELSGQSYVKAHHRRLLQPQLLGRSELAIEKKHQNISSILMSLKLPFINGYKPLSNLQQILTEEVGQYLLNNPSIFDLFYRFVDTKSELFDQNKIQFQFDEKPTIYPKDVTSEVPQRYNLTGVDYLLREAQNQSLGDQGERFIMHFERQRLASEGLLDLAEKVEQVSKTKGAHMGFDILSFNSDQSERFIEVKTTKLGASTPFYITENEVTVSEKFPHKYQLYRVYNFQENPKVYRLKGSMRNSCHLKANSYRAMPV